MIADNGCFDLVSNRSGDIAGDQTRATFATLGAHGTNQARVLSHPRRFGVPYPSHF
jgi:hypothetical protein